jgi:hypothetical protein
LRSGWATAAVLVTVLLAGCAPVTRSGANPDAPSGGVPGTPAGASVDELPGASAGEQPGASVDEQPGASAPSPGATATVPAATSVTDPMPTAVPAATPLAAARPPAAYLQGDGLDAPGAPGAEGSFVWDGFGSDSPWIVMPLPATSGGGPWTVTVDPPLQVERWVVWWARVTAGSAGREEQRAEGSGASIRIEAPTPPGTWSLRVEAWFGPGRHAAWYWGIDVEP